MHLLSHHHTRLATRTQGLWGSLLDICMPGTPAGHFYVGEEGLLFNYMNIDFTIKQTNHSWPQH